MKKTVFLFAILLSAQIASAQKEFPNLNKGNKLYEKENFTDAEIQYRNALLKNQKSDVATFNLGNALYRQQKYDEACKEFQQVTSLSNDNEVKAQAFHNMGNSFLQKGELQEAINAYKSALKLNPNDNETRYNLAYANTLKKQQEQQQQNQDQNQDQKQNMNKQNNDQKPDEQKDEQQQKQQMQNVQKDENQMTQENAQRILDAFSNDEKETQEKLNRSRATSNKKYIEKDW